MTDVTGGVDLSSPVAVGDAIAGTCAGMLARADRALVATALDDLVALYAGRFPGFGTCHTPYHDRQHAFDVALTLARMLRGHRERVPDDMRMDGRQAAVSLVCALFHDAGYIRRRADRRMPHGAGYNRIHVARSGRFVADYMTALGHAERAPAARRIVGYTAHSYPGRRGAGNWVVTAGTMLASADLLAQLADPWYLEKCRYRLHPEFVIAGVLSGAPTSRDSVRELLRRTPGFVAASVAALDGPLGGVHRHLEALYDGRNPYLEALGANRARLDALIASDDFSTLRPPPNWPCG